MDAVYVGWLSILPPVIAIILALITKEVLFFTDNRDSIRYTNLFFRVRYQSDYRICFHRI